MFFMVSKRRSAIIGNGVRAMAGCTIFDGATNVKNRR